MVSPPTRGKLIGSVASEGVVSSPQIKVPVPAGACSLFRLDEVPVGTCSLFRDMMKYEVLVVIVMVVIKLFLYIRPRPGAYVGSEFEILPSIRPTYIADTNPLFLCVRDTWFLVLELLALVVLSTSRLVRRKYIYNL